MILKITLPSRRKFGEGSSDGREIESIALHRKGRGDFENTRNLFDIMYKRAFREFASLNRGSTLLGTFSRKMSLNVSNSSCRL